MRKYGKWIFFEGRWIPVFAGGAPDEPPQEPSQEPSQEPPQGTPQKNEPNPIEQEYKRTLQFLQEKFGVSSIDELALKLKSEEEQKLKEQQKYKELAESFLPCFA